MQDLQLIKAMQGIRNAVEKVADVKPGEDVLIVSSWTVDKRIPFGIALVCGEIGAKPRFFIQEEYRDGDDLCPSLAAAVVAADVVFELGTHISHTRGCWRAVHEYGTRWVSISSRLDVLSSDGAKVNPFLLSKISRMVGERILRGSSIRVTSQGGSSLTCGVTANRVGGGVVELARNPGGWIVFPPGACNINPVPGTANGVLYLDAYDAHTGVVQMLGSSTQKWIVEKGWVKEIAGDGAELFKNLTSKAPNGNYFVEVAVGVSPVGTGTRKAGVMHFGIGNANLDIGSNKDRGKASPYVHGDGVILKPTLEVIETGDIVVDNGYLTVLDSLSDEEKKELTI